MSQTTQKTPSSTKSPYLAVPLDLMRDDSVTDFDIYLSPQRQGEQFVLYRERHLPFTAEVRQRLREAGVEEIFVESSQQKEYQQYLEGNLGAVLADAKVAPERKSKVLYTSLTGLIGEVMADPRSGDVVPRSADVVNHTCRFLYDQQGALLHLMRVSSYDYYTYTHSVNVFVFTLALAQRVLKRSEVNEEFGLGALLHDIGKSLIAPEIVNAKGKLTDAQFEIMKKHPVYGYDLLVEQGGVGPVGLDLVRHHHEKPNGRGYPDGLKGDEISRNARIIKIADVFDALTTRRSYKDALNSFPALKLMKEEMIQELDSELFGIFVKMMGSPGA